MQQKLRRKIHVWISTKHLPRWPPGCCRQAVYCPYPPGWQVASGDWKRYQAERIAVEDVDRLFPAGCNLALVGGSVSGNLECLDFDHPDLFPLYLEPRYLDYVLGITKAYTTRVGGGPFPTELFDATGAYLAERGHEFGATTGRARRCGWFDAVALRRSILNNSVSGLCVTKLDVLDGLDSIQMCVGYQCGLQKLDNAPLGAEALAACEPIYEEMPGWQESTFGVRCYMRICQANARAYLQRIAELTDTPIDIISTGPDRAETIVMYAIRSQPDRCAVPAGQGGAGTAGLDAVGSIIERQRKSPIFRPGFSRIWCRREDLNLHWVSPTKT